MNPPDRGHAARAVDLDSPPISYPAETKIISTIALLVLGYYVLSFFDAWPATLKRSLYEWLVTLIPSSFLYAMQSALVRLGRLSPADATFVRSDFGHWDAKDDVIRRLLGQAHMPLALRKVRSLSGVGHFISLSNEPGPPGLGNWDNSCYQNSVLQGLASLPAFRDFVHASLDHGERHHAPVATHRALVEFLEQLADASRRQTVVWTPKILKSMDSWQQQDAQEYFSRVLETIEKEADQYIKAMKRCASTGLECLATGAGSPPAVVDGDSSQMMQKYGPGAQRNPLDGMTAQSLKCRTCGYTEGWSLTLFNCLTLNLGLRGPSSVEDLLDEYTTPEDVDGVECEHCTKLAHGAGDADDAPPNASAKGPRKSVLRTKSKQITVGRLPKDLVLHINRSIYDEYGDQLKNTAPVHVPARLEFLSRWCAPLDAHDASVQANYQLKCVVTHYGRHDNGHYIAYGQRGKDWYCFNDEIVTKVTEADVLRVTNGFMVFYEAEQWPPAIENEAVSSPPVIPVADTASELDGSSMDVFMADMEAELESRSSSPIDDLVDDSDVSMTAPEVPSTPLEQRPEPIQLPPMRTAGTGGALTPDHSPSSASLVPAV